MDILSALCLGLTSIILGICITLAVQWYIFQKYMTTIPYVGPPETPISEPFSIPQSLEDALKSSSINKKESCIALNLLFQFLFKELRHAQKVQKWFRRKLSLEFEELLTRTTTGKLFDSVKIRDIHLGTQFPEIKAVTVKDVVLNEEHKHIDTLNLCLDLEYSGGFQLSIDTNMVLGKAAYLSVKVNNLSGMARLQFTRLPYTHWSFSFYSEPVLELQVESQFQGRPLPHINSLIVSQIRKALNKKHTLPNYKLRHKPFFTKPVPEDEEEESGTPGIIPGNLQVTVLEISRLMENPLCELVHCSLAIDSLAWVEMLHSDNARYVSLEIPIFREGSQQLGLIFRQEFIAERYQDCVVVEVVAPLSPTASADVRRGDILVSIDNKRISSLSQAARILKTAGDRFTLRVERRVWSQEKELDVLKSVEIEKPRDGLRHRKASDDSDSSSSSPASLPGSPAKRHTLPRSNQPSPDHKQKTIAEIADSCLPEDYLQIHKTKELPFNQVLQFEETLNFDLQQKHRYLNISVWGKSSGRLTMLGHVSILLEAVCNASRQGYHLKKCALLPPDPHTAMSRSHKLVSHSGFEPCLCYGDILLSFKFISGNVMAPAPSKLPPSQSMEIPTDDRKRHAFVRTHFHRTTQCEYCGKKIWLKDAVQCRDCAMTCHKKCVTKCQGDTICGVPRRASDVSVPPRSPSPPTRRASAQPEIITTAAEEETQAPARLGIGSLLAAQMRGLKRVGSANNLALPSSGPGSHSSRSLPPSPQHSPCSSRKASLVEAPFRFPQALLDNEDDEVSAALSHLLQHSSDQDPMALAKSTGKDLYSELPLHQRKDKINILISKLKSAIDSETQARLLLAKGSTETKDEATQARFAFLIGKSDEKVQALAVLMLHCCAGLQHVRDQEDSCKGDVQPEHGENLAV